MGRPGPAVQYVSLYCCSSASALQLSSLHRVKALPRREHRSIDSYPWQSTQQHSGQYRIPIHTGETRARSTSHIEVFSSLYLLLNQCNLRLRLSRRLLTSHWKKVEERVHILHRHYLWQDLRLLIKRKAQVQTHQDPNNISRQRREPTTLCSNAVHRLPE